MVVESKIDLHRMTVAEASRAVELALFRADQAGLSELRIVHGHGTGTLRAAVIALVNKHQLVARHGPAGPAEGGYGVTVAVLKRGAHKRLSPEETQRLSTPVSLKRK